jgi:pimeloyl-ACP methyl ester carboxylesterase
MTSTAEPPTRAEPRSRFVERDGRQLHLLEWVNDRPRATIFAIHGGCANAHWWDASAVTLASAYRVVALDLAGHGRSDRIDDGAYSLERHRDDVAHVVRALGLDGFVLMGHSFGAFVALAALPAVVGRLGALILVDSRGHIRPRSARYLSALSRFTNPVYATEEEARQSFQLLPRASAATPEVIDQVARRSIRCAADGTWSLAFDRRALRAAQARELDAEMRQWNGPTLLIRGSESTALSTRALREMSGEFTDAETAEIADAHHHVMLDQPGAFARAVDDFLKRRITG